MGNEGGMTMVLMITMMMICCGIGGVSSAVYTVGESSGWSMGADYSTWASDKTLQVGDTLVFNYASGHNVDEVSANDYKSCTTGNALSTDSSGATSITLKTAGPHYFICGIPGHCGGGMKLAVTVAAAAAPTDGTKTSPSAGTTTTSPPSTTADAPPVSPTAVTSPAGGAATEHPSSSAASSVPSAAAFLAVSVAALNIVLR